jgi:hypothetical protein
LDYASWDRIADAVNPMLGVITLALSLAIRRAGSPPRWAQLLLTLTAVAGIYAVGWLDARFALWAAAGADYSTHTAVCVALVVSLYMIDWRLGVAGTVIAVLYGMLMLTQKYHSPADMGSTMLVIAPLAFGIWILGRRMLNPKASAAP